LIGIDLVSTSAVSDPAADPASFPPRWAPPVFFLTGCRENFWFYRDRTGLPRGPMTIETVKKCYINGVVDQHTLFWGNGLGDWVPLRNLRGMGDCLNDPKTRFLKFIVNRFVYPVAERRRNRDRLHAEGKAKSPTMTKEQVAEWRRRREERLVAGEESTMLSLSLATGRRERAARRSRRRGGGWREGRSRRPSRVREEEATRPSERSRGLEYTRASSITPGARAAMRVFPSPLRASAII
jgi:hypothetical protein